MYNASYRYDIWKYSTFKNTYHFFRLWKYLFLHIQIVCKLENNEYFLHTKNRNICPFKIHILLFYTDYKGKAMDVNI